MICHLKAAREETGTIAGIGNKVDFSSNHKLTYSSSHSLSDRASRKRGVEQHNELPLCDHFKARLHAGKQLKRVPTNELKLFINGDEFMKL